MSTLEQIALDIQNLALELGAEEVAVSVSNSVSTELTQREGKLESSKQSNSLGVGIELLVDGRFSGHSASDVRLSALRPFLQRAIEATRFLEEDPNRRLPTLAEMGVAQVDIEAYDSSWDSLQPQDRRDRLNALETATHHASQQLNVRNLTHHVWDSKVQSHFSASNGYSTGWERSSFGMGAEITLVDGERLPEAYDYRSARFENELPSVDALAAELVKRSTSRIGSSSIQSAKLPVLFRNFSAGKVLGTLLAPLRGSAIYEKRSCLLDKVGTQIASTGLSLIDQPHIPRASHSRRFDDDGFATQNRSIIENGVLQCYLLNLYNARRLETLPTLGSTTNLCVPPSQNTPDQLIEGLAQCIVIEGFLGGNANPITGDFSYGITGRYFENGRFVQGISEMNISGNILELLQNFVGAGNDVWTYSNYRVPSLLFADVQCSGV